jgi:acetyltransferase
MKMSAPSSHKTEFIPDFSGRPRRMNLDQIVAVKGLGKLKLRPICLEDEKEMVDFHRRISEESIYMRYFEYLGLDQRTSHERLVRICTNTPDSYAVVVEKPEHHFRPAAILAVGRLTKTVEPLTATFDTLIADEAQIPKLARILLTRLIKFAQAFSFQKLTGELLVVDHDALNLCRFLHFSTQTISESGTVGVSLLL